MGIPKRKEASIFPCIFFLAQYWQILAVADDFIQANPYVFVVHKLYGVVKECHSRANAHIYWEDLNTFKPLYHFKNALCYVTY